MASISEEPIYANVFRTLALLSLKYYDYFVDLIYLLKFYFRAQNLTIFSQAVLKIVIVLLLPPGS